MFLQQLDIVHAVDDGSPLDSLLGELLLIVMDKLRCDHRIMIALWTSVEPTRMVITLIYQRWHALILHQALPLFASGYIGLRCPNR
jgi:hypothetical protein